jgi:hypothetical protein
VPRTGCFKHLYTSTVGTTTSPGYFRGRRGWVGITAVVIGGRATGRATGDSTGRNIGRTKPLTTLAQVLDTVEIRIGSSIVSVIVKSGYALLF